MMAESEKETHRRTAYLLWLGVFLAALVLYVAWNEPLRRMALNLVPHSFALLFLASCAGYGSLFTPRLVRSQDRSLHILASIALGIGLTALFIFIAGSLALFSKALFQIWGFAGSLLFVLAIPRWSKQTTLNFPSRKAGWNILAAGILLLTLGAVLPSALAPEVSRDALEYHLLIPKIYLQMGRIAYIPLLVESNYPSLAEYVYLPIYALAGDIPCKAFHFLIGLCLLATMRKITQKLNPESDSLLAPALFISMPVAAVLTTWAWNDFFLTFFILMCLYFLIQYQTAAEAERSNLDLLAAGIMAGLAAWTKYTFAIFLAVLVLLAVIGIPRWKRNLRKLAYIFLPIGFFISIWAIKNMVLTGNPVYPFLNGIFQSPQMTAQAFEYFQTTLTRYEFPDWTWKNYLLFPFLISLKPNIIDVHTGILPLVVIPLLFVKSPAGGMRLMKLSVLFYFLIWAILQMIVRSLLPMLAILFCIVAAALPLVKWPSKRVRYAFQTLVILAAISNFVITSVTTYHLFDPVKAFLGLESRAQYRTRLANSQPLYDYLNSAADVHKVLLVGLHNPLYLNKPAIFSSCCDPPAAEVLTRRSASSEEIARRVQSAGITHIVVDYEEYSREHKARLYSWSGDEKKHFEKFVTEHCERSAAQGNKVVYKVRP